ncbi:MAG: HEAT repeat domain-containing protein [Chloroflexi bacterium]|nr:HEAT repeat domain-containing protein [Chloroflexota bacterium]
MVLFSASLTYRIYKSGPTWLRRFIVQHLDLSNHHLVVRVLPRALQDSDDSIHAIALQHLRRYRPPGQRELPRNRSVLMQLLLSPHTSDRTRQRIRAYLLRKRDPSLLPLLEKAFNEDQARNRPDIRLYLTEILGSLPPSPRVQSLLISRLHDNSPSVRACVMQILGSTGDDEAVPYLCEIISEAMKPLSILKLEDARMASKAIQAIERRKENTVTIAASPGSRHSTPAV